MAINFTDGFDWWDNTFINSSAGDKYSLPNITFLQAATAAGRFGGTAFNVFNTAFGVAEFYNRVSDLTLSMHMALKLGGSTGNFNVFYSIKQGSAGIVSLALDASDNLKVYTGGSGTNGAPGSLLATVTAPFSTTVWHSLELFVIVAGAGSTVEVWIDDIAVVQMDGTVSLSGTPDRAGYRWENFGSIGIILDDYVQSDGSGALNNTRLGPLEIVTIYPSGNGFTSGWTSANGHADYTNVNQVVNAPDSDLLYISGTDSASDLFMVATPACIGLILGIGFNGLARGVSSLASMDLACAPEAGLLPTVQLGNFAVVSAPTLYTVYQAISETNLATGQNNWTDGDIGRAWWGPELSANSCRVGQINLEKVVSLRAVPFDCGQGAGSYTF